MELFERIRRAYEFEKKSIRAIARQYGVHRRMVRQAIANAIPPDRKTPQRSQPQMDEVKEFIKQILEKDKKEPRKQHHTAHRIFVRIGKEMSGIKVSERTVGTQARSLCRKRRARPVARTGAMDCGL